MTPIFTYGETEAKSLGQGLPASKEQSQDSGPSPPGTSILSPCAQLALSLGSEGWRRLFGGTSGQPTPGPSPLAEDCCPFEVYPTRGGGGGGGWGGRALNPEPSLHAQPMPRVSSQSAGQAPTRFHHFLPGRRPQGNAGRADRPGGRLPPPLTRRSPVNPSPAICLPGTHLLSRPICSQGSPQGHFTKATVPTGRLPSVGANRRARETSPAHHHHHPLLCGFSLLPMGSV